MHQIWYQALEEVFICISTCYLYFTSEVMETLAFAPGVVTNEEIKVFLSGPIITFTSSWIQYMIWKINCVCVLSLWKLGVWIPKRAVLGLSTLMCPTLKIGEPAHSRAPPRGSSDWICKLYHHFTLYLPGSTEANKCSEGSTPFPCHGPEFPTRVSELDSSVDNTWASSFLGFFYILLLLFS